MDKFEIFMNHATQMDVLIEMLDGSVVEIIRDYSGDIFCTHDCIKDFIDETFNTSYPMDDFDSMFITDNKDLSLIKTQYPDAMKLYWGNL